VEPSKTPFPNARLVDLGDAELAVREWGDPGLPAIFFWHSLGPASSGAVIVEVAPRLVEAGWRVVAVDGPGFGASPLLPPERYAIDELVELARRLISALDLEVMTFMGHSWGGAIAVRFAGAFPERVRALVLLDSGHIDYRELHDVDAERPVEAWIAFAREQAVSWEGREAFEDDFREALKRPTPELLEAFFAGTRAEGSTLLGSSAEARGAAMAGLVDRVSEAWPVLAERRIPTLLLLATEPPHVDQNREHIGRFESAVPHAEVRWVPGAGHGILGDVGPPLGDEIAEWLAGLEAEEVGGDRAVDRAEPRE
jgi:pimeloyl-ACP methyl ester carboxylesterase